MNQEKTFSGNFNFSQEVKNGRITDNRGTLPGFERNPEEKRKTSSKPFKKPTKKPPKAGQISRKTQTTKGVKK